MRVNRFAAFAAVAALLLAAAFPTTRAALDRYIEDTDRFPGWKGELPTVTVDYKDSSIEDDGQNEGAWSGKMELLSWEPRAYVLHGFMTPSECDHLMALGNGTMRKSTVADSRTGRSVDSTVRTSTGTFLSRGHDDVVSRIERRIALVSMIPEENGEGVQLLRYVNGQKYEPHTDYFHDAVNKDESHGGQRIATMLMYLTTPEAGGETVFPHGKGPPKKLPGEPGYDGWEWSECAQRGLAARAIRGNALLFFGLHPDASEDYLSTHGSCPTLAGEKWSATKWMHVHEFNAGVGGRRSAGCSDSTPQCAEWAAAGECQKNAGFMLEKCAKSCGQCSKDAKKRTVGRKVGAT